MESDFIMEMLKWIQELFANYGYNVLFFGLLLEFVALPFPGETTMAFAGFLSYTGRLDFLTLVVVAFAGTTAGMTITYFIGLKAGLPFIQRYGKWFLFSPAKLEKTQRWFERYGSFLISIGYFIPGVRHFTGYFAGIIALPFRKFALYAYGGALIWVILFLGIGKVFGPQWTGIFHLFELYALWIVSGAAALAVLIVLIRYRRILTVRVLRRSPELELKTKLKETSKER
ncbi:membrane protein DedA with SNARE-associated domain [Paenibacillus sp. PastM-3]|nr:membrane protein DedA with SNARE-associated domain [Paenibacillus sp. PastM-2]MDH6483170.1 membrane protein DedA with SNARE-associated domain [Paenibacillus sp. PastH-2]MDH6510573.1 membrane protein DedA with SNARE-associated domain [Paenibacillus sp. PastM-3]